MQHSSIKELPEDSVRTLLGQIPFFNDLALEDYQQFNLLLDHSSIVELAPGEIIIKKGTTDKHFYFLLKGQLDVFPNEQPEEKAISQLSSGQVFGALSIVNELPRTATLAASNDEKASLFATDFSIFGELEDFSQIKLTTKLSFLRIVVNNTKWKLEVNRMNEPEHPLAKKLSQIESFSGDKDTIAELQSLSEQAFLLGQLLDLWNNTATPTIELPERIRQKESTMAKLRSLFSSKTDT